MASTECMDRFIYVTKLIELILRLHFTSFTACARCFVSPSLALLFTMLVFKRPNLVIIPPRTHNHTFNTEQFIIWHVRSHRSRHLILPGIVKCTRQKFDQRKCIIAYFLERITVSFASYVLTDTGWSGSTIDRSMISDHRPRIMFMSTVYLLIKPTLRNAEARTVCVVLWNYYFAFIN